MLWYHDHALGITRLNVYAGMFGCFIVRDDFEDGLNLPKGKYEIPLTMYDRSFDADGQLFYPTSEIRNRRGSRKCLATRCWSTASYFHIWMSSPASIASVC